MRWWNVNNVSPSGLRLNRAWHLRQFLVALIPPACAWVMFEGVCRWEESTRLLRAKGKGKESSSKVKVTAEELVLADTNHSDQQPVVQGQSVTSSEQSAWMFVPDGEYKTFMMNIQHEFMREYDGIREKMHIKRESVSDSLFGNPVLDAVRRAVTVNSNGIDDSSSASVIEEKKRGVEVAAAAAADATTVATESEGGATSPMKNRRNGNKSSRS